jgi:hypothetical protein
MRGPLSSPGKPRRPLQLRSPAAASQGCLGLHSLSECACWAIWRTRVCRYPSGRHPVPRLNRVARHYTRFELRGRVLMLLLRNRHLHLHFAERRLGTLANATSICTSEGQPGGARSPTQNARWCRRGPRPAVSATSCTDGLRSSHAPVSFSSAGSGSSVEMYSEHRNPATSRTRTPRSLTPFERASPRRLTGDRPPRRVDGEEHRRAPCSALVS